MTALKKFQALNLKKKKKQLKTRGSSCGGAAAPCDKIRGLNRDGRLLPASLQPFTRPAPSRRGGHAHRNSTLGQASQTGPAKTCCPVDYTELHNSLPAIFFLHDNQ